LFEETTIVVILFTLSIMR